MHAADELRRAFEAAGSVFCVAARQMTAAATHLQKPLLGDVPKCPLVSMECGGRRRSCHDGRIPSTQALCEPATIVASDVADGAHSPRGLAVRLVHRPRLQGILPLATGVLRKLLPWAR
ncbi:MAG: hypothetical protein AUI45_04125 [Acidobacteria bacterium 13_1_40CM_2_56_11]|nr:MAG: hypothetical protein AUI45_04125 [Acidobacteria bacterium 13_1_40CM_2_56_11]